MSQAIHTVESPDKLNPILGDRIIIGVKAGQVNVVGSGAGAEVTIAITGMQLPANYAVMVSPNQDATWYVTSKSAAGFTIHLAPRLAASTLAAGTVDFVVVG
jgi:hypothetical protein